MPMVMGSGGWARQADAAVASSAVGRYFRLDGSGHAQARRGACFSTELRAGLATFFAMAYIISVNANIVSQSGGTCVCDRARSPDAACDADPRYALCLQELNRDLITATAAISALTSVAMGLFANLPVAAAPGMGLNAYFAFNVVGYHGTGAIPYTTALTAVFAEGFIFVALTALGLRQWLALAIPRSIKLATTVGIGLFLTLIGLTYSAGIGLVQGASSTPLELAGCSAASFDEETGRCPSSQKMRSPTMWLGIFLGGVFTVFLIMFRVKGAIIMGILLVSIISWPRPTPVTYFPYTEAGDSAFAFFKQAVAFRPIKHVLAVQDWNVSDHAGQFVVALITFLYVDIMDCTGCLYAMADYCGVVDQETQDFEGSAVAYTVDAMGITIGSLLGTSPVTAYIESGAGISEGGRTGLTAIVTGLCFFLSIFFAPIFASIPPWATGGTLVIVGALMAKAAADINWSYLGDAVPAFLTIALMPFTYSIAYGLIGGIASSVVLNLGVWVIGKASGHRLKPPDQQLQEPWAPTSRLLPPWLTRAARGTKDFWRAPEEARAISHDHATQGQEPPAHLHRAQPAKS